MFSAFRTYKVLNFRSALLPFMVTGCFAQLALAGEIVQDYEFSFPNLSDCFDNQGECTPWDSSSDLVLEELFPIVPQKVASILIKNGDLPVNVRVETSFIRTVPYKFKSAVQQFPLTPGAYADRVVEPYKDEIFPANWHGKWRVDNFRGYKIVRVPLYPFRIVSDSMANYVQSMRVVIETHEIQVEAAGVERSTRKLARDEYALQSRIDNVELAEPVIVPPSEEFGYLVIGPRALIGTPADTPLRALLDEKESRHINTYLVALEDIGSRPGPEEIRKYIKNAYQKDSVDYVLLIGDKGNLPWKYVPSGMRGDGDPVPSDQYYACLDGEFSSPSTIDWACEVSVGRIGARSRQDVANWVAKNLVFKQAIKEKRTLSTLSFGERLDSRTLGGRMLDYISSGTTKAPATKGFPGQINVTKLYDGSGPEVPASKFLETLNNGDFHVVNHLGHANHNYVFRMNDNSIDGFKSRPAFYYSQGCYPNDPDKDNWTIKAVRMPNYGPVAMIANTRYGWYAPGNSEEGSSSVLHRTFWATRFEKGLKRIGEMNHRAKEIVSAADKSALMTYTLLESNLIGDPELDLGL